MSAFNNARDLTIESGAALSSDLELAGQAVICIWVPGNFVGTYITLQGARGGSRIWSDLYDETGTEIGIPVVAGRVYTVPVEWTLGFDAVRVRAGTAASPSNQAATVAIGLSFRPFA